MCAYDYRKLAHSNNMDFNTKVVYTLIHIIKLIL